MTRLTPPPLEDAADALALAVCYLQQAPLAAAILRASRRGA
jgi:Holliday junction resolvasome RuvABC endonuclease subunit